MALVLVTPVRVQVEERVHATREAATKISVEICMHFQISTRQGNVRARPFVVSKDGANVDAINELLKSRGGEEFDSQYGLSAYMPFGPSIYCPERGRMVRPPEERSVSAEESGEASEVNSDESDDDAPGAEDSDDSSSVPEFLYAFRW